MSSVGDAAMTKNSNLPLYKPPLSRDLTDLGASGIPNAVCSIGSAVSLNNCAPVGISPTTGSSKCQQGYTAVNKCDIGNVVG